jgi:hypothetical protein
MTRHCVTIAAGLALALAGPAVAAETEADPLGFESALAPPAGHWQQHLAVDVGLGDEGRGSHLVWRYGLTEGLTLAADIDEVHVAPGAGAHWGFGLQAGLHREDAWPALAAGVREMAVGKDVELTGYLAWQRHLGPALLQGDVEVRQTLLGGGTHLAGHVDAAWLLGASAWLIELESDTGFDTRAPKWRLIPGWRHHLLPSLQVGVGLPLGLSSTSAPVGVIADMIAGW